MAVADEPLSNREILSHFDEERRNRKAIDDRVTGLAANSVTIDAWTRENGHLQKDIATVDAHCEERHKTAMAALEDLGGELRSAIGEVKTALDKRSDRVWTRVLAIASILAVLATAYYAAAHQGVR